jgi:hypothetical protein
VTFISVLPADFVEVTPLPSVILHLPFTLYVLCLVLFVWRLFVRVIFIILWLLQIWRPEFPFILVTKVFLDFENISIRNSQ